MIYEGINQQIELVLTTSCNSISCDYCLYNGNNKPVSLSNKGINKHLPYIMEYINKLPNTSICLVGGEIGLVDYDQLSLLFSYINKPVIISTNGLFVDNGYNVSFDDHISIILLHLLPDSVNTKYIGIPKVLFGQVFSNKTQIIPFLNKSRDFPIDYLSYDFSLYDTHIYSCKEVYNLYCYLYDVACKYSNITNNCIKDIQTKIKLIQNLHSSRKACACCNETISINLENQTIQQCSGKSLHSIILNKKNLLSMLSIHNPFFPENEFCNNCVPWCIEKQISRILSIKKQNMAFL